MLSEIQKIDYPQRTGNFVLWCGLTRGQEKLLELFAIKLEQHTRLSFEEIIPIYKEYVAKNKNQDDKLNRLYAKNWFVRTIGMLVLKRFIIVSEAKLLPGKTGS